MAHSTGIYRSTTTTTGTSVAVLDTTSALSCLSDETRRAITHWEGNVHGQYKSIEKDKNDFLLSETDATMNTNNTTYTQITSPIRRLVDLLNQIALHEILTNTPVTVAARDFYVRWVNQLDLLNQSMRSIRKVQSECNIIAMCNARDDLLTNTFSGILFDRISKQEDGVYQYMVYIEDIKWLSKIVCRTLVDNYSRAQFRLFYFDDEDHVHRKIRLMLV